jgi:hypothetical protein
MRAALEKGLEWVAAHASSGEGKAFPFEKHKNQDACQLEMKWI